MLSQKYLYKSIALVIAVLFLMLAVIPQAAFAIAPAIHGEMPEATLPLGYGDAYSFGRNSEGRLGHGDTVDRHVPTKIEGLGPVASVAAANFGRFALVLLANGDVYSSGSNFYGQLGHGDKDDRATLTKIQGLGPAKAVAVGAGHCLVLLENGDVYSFGLGNHGQLGRETRTNADSYVPGKIEGIGPVQAISASASHSLVLLENGEVYGFGRNDGGQLGLGAGAASTRTPVKIEGVGLIKGISAGNDFSLLLTNTGEVYGFGSNDYNQLGSVAGDKV